jgi:hypothetical protein
MERFSSLYQRPSLELVQLRYYSTVNHTYTRHEASDVQYLSTLPVRTGRVGLFQHNDLVSKPPGPWEACLIMAPAPKSGDLYKFLFTKARQGELI